MRDRRAVRGGYLLILSLLVLTGLTALTTVSITRASTELLAANRFANQAKAFAQAEAGIECALQQLRNTSDRAQVAASCSVAGSSTVTLSAGLSNPITISSAGTNSGASSTATAVVQRTSLSPFQQATYGLGVAAGGGQLTGVKISSAGFVNSYSSSAGPYGGGNIAANAELRTNSTLTYGTAITVSGGGSQVNGSAYSPAGGIVYQETPGVSITGTIGVKPVQAFATPVLPAEPWGGGTPPGCTNLANLNVTGKVTLAGTSYCATSITVNGGTLSFPNLQTLYVTGNTDVINDGALVAGQGTVRTATLTVNHSTVEMTNTTPLFYVSNAATLNNGGTLRVGQGTIRAQTLSMNYQSNDPGASLVVGSASTTGLVEVYTESFQIDQSSTLNTTTHNPALLRLYGTSSSPVKFSVSHGSSVYGTLYATNGEVSVDTSSSVYGALIGLECTVTNAWLHYDEALKTLYGWPSWLNQATVTLLAQY